MEAFGIVLIAVSVVAVVVAAISFYGSGRIYKGLGRSGAFSMDKPDMGRAPKAGSPAARAEALEETRQLLEAKSYRRVERGEEPLDIEAEMAALTSQPTAQDEELREEVRQLVIARNERRMRRGEEPLDVEAEVDRQLRDLAG